MMNVYILAGLVIVFFIAVIIACYRLLQQPSTNKTISICSPRQQKRQSLDRATLRANLLVAGGSIDIPRRRA